MLVPALEGHRLWAASYETSLNPLLALERRVLPDLIRAAATTRVVDVACGTGRWTAWFADRGSSVIGIDLCEEMLARVPERLHGCVALGGAEDLPIGSQTVDLAICSFAAGYFRRLERAMSEMARITRIGGRVVIADLHPAATAAGWTRSFRASGRAYEIEHFRYSLEDFGVYACRAGLHLTAELHSCIGEPERPIFEMAGRPEGFAEVAGIPAVWIGSWRKV